MTTKQEVIDNVTIITKTFERPDALDKTIKSILKRYPGITILVADDSKVPTTRTDVTVFTMPFDSGCSAGRNLLVDNVKTKYFVSVDDDWNFTKNTNLEEMLDILETTDIDVICGGWEKRNPICASLRHEGDHVIATDLPTDAGKRFYYCDFSYQFLMVDTEKFKQNVAWDDELKTIEHLFLFIDMLGKLKVAYTHNSKILHEDGGSKNDTNYMKYRTRRDFFATGLKKRGIKKYTNFNGKVRTLDW